jgi:signal transduction histidine kinase
MDDRHFEQNRSTPGVPLTPSASTGSIPAVPETIWRALETSVEVVQLLPSAPALVPLLKQLCGLLHARYPWDHVAILIIDASGATLVAWAVAGEAPRDLRLNASRVPVEEMALLSRVVSERQPLWLEAPSHRAEVRPRLLLPLTTQARFVGVMDIGGESLAHDPALDLLADHIALAIDQAQRREDEVQQRQLVERLNDIGRTLTQTLDPEQVLDMVLMQIAGIVPHDRSAIMLEEGNELAMRATRGFPEHADPLRIRVPIREDDVYRTIRSTRRPLLVPDVSQRPDWQFVADLPPAQSWLGVPLVVEGSVIGMLSLTREHANTYTAGEVALSVAFAQQASAALHNASLYDDLSRVNTALERTVAELQQRTRDLEITYQQLKRLDQAKTDFIAVASHELRTPLTVISGYGQMLAHDPTVTGDEYRAHVVQGLLNGATRLNSIIDDMLDMARIDNQAMDIRPEPLFVDVLIKAIRPTLSQILQDRKITLSLDRSLAKLPCIEADTVGIRKVFHHLMVNAVKYTPDGGSVGIRGRTLASHETSLGKEAVEVVVSDTGIGIDPVVQELIFAKFYQTGQVSVHSSGPERFKGGGPGLGLAISRGIIEAHGGTIWVESPGYDEVLCPGSDFHVVLPQHPDVGLSGSQMVGTRDG